MGKTTLESHGIESPGGHGPHLCGRCRLRSDVGAGLLGALVLHLIYLLVLGDLSGMERADLLDPRTFWPLYAVGACLGLGHGMLHLGENPWPGWTFFSCLGISVSTFVVAMHTLPDPGACMPEPGMPWIGYPMAIASPAFFLLAASFFAEWARHRMRDVRELSPTFLAGLRLLAPALLTGAVLAQLVWVEGSRPGADVTFFPVAAGILSGVAASLSARRE